MVKTVVSRIEPDAIDIIKSYEGKGSLSEGIRVMHRKIQALESTTPTLSYTSTPTADTGWIPGGDNEDGMPKAYWKRLKKEVDTIIQQYAGR